MKKSRLIVTASLVSSLVLGISPAFAQGTGPQRTAPESLQELKIQDTTGLVGVERLSPELASATGPVKVVVRLAGQPVAYTYAAGAEAAEQVAAGNSIAAAQADVIAAAQALDSSAAVLGQTRNALNAVILRMEASQLAALSQNPGVLSIHPVRDYTMDLGETVPYIGATAALRAEGVDGSGVLVAVIDSGVDYTHIKLGGDGLLSTYARAYCGDPAAIPNPTDPACTAAKLVADPALFPNSKVVGGWDFVGETWPLTAEQPDPNPIDFDGHGSHVADIIAGLEGGGVGEGVAPGAEILAIRACSAVSTSCSGIALLQAVDYALDPNGDGDLDDRAQIINMSLGSNYGTAYNDDLSHAVDGATVANTLVVASAGNGGNRPYIAGTPASAWTALSVAQTQVPGATQYALRITAPASIAGLFTATATVEWAPITTGFSGDIAYVGRACPADSIAAGSPADPLLVSPAGKVALIDRGACAVSLKVDYAADAGAIAVIVADSAPATEAPSFSFGGGDTMVQTLIVTQAIGTRIKSGLAAGVSVAVNPADATPLVGSMAATSSRGPSNGQMFYGNSIMYGQLIKPEIGAPGASVSAIAGGGTATEAFGGTSGAAPMVSGAAALLLDSRGGIMSPWDMKVRLMNTGETNIYTTPAALGGTLAPITRIGGGEVRVDRAVEADVFAWDLSNRGGSLSFGFVDVNRPTITLRRTVVVYNDSDKPVQFNVQPTFRYGDDQASGIVSVSAPSTLTVGAGRQRTFRVQLTIDAAKMGQWTLNSGSQGGNGNLLNAHEIDGYLNLVDASGNTANNIHMAWHVLPRLSDNVVANRTTVNFNSTVEGLPAGTLQLRNRGAGTAFVDTYELIGTSENLSQSDKGQAPVIDLKAVGVATFPGELAGCDGSFVMQVAISSYYRQSHATGQGLFNVDLDIDRDGVYDFEIYNYDRSTTTVRDGRNVAWAYNLRTGLQSAFFFTGHSMEASNYVLTVCSEQITDEANGIVPAIGAPMNVRVWAQEVQLANAMTDMIDGMVIVPLGERYGAMVNDIAPGATETLTVIDFGATANTSKGVLLFLDGARGAARSGATSGNEALLISAP
ncbi:MAG TPA: S8 family serine peptidase [Anaerolineales bacterium]|nr:S8 family serine peptidase [Anaerolineales bacterium]